MEIKKIILHRLQMTLKNPFSTSFGTMKEKDFFLIEVVDEFGCQGFGESTAFTSPWYTEETVKTTEHMLEEFLIPLVLKEPIHHPDEVSQRFQPIRRNQMAKAAIEGAIWDLYAKRQGVSLAKCIGGEKTSIDVGISIGIQPSTKDLLQVIEKAVSDGYKRIKIKVKRGMDIVPLQEVRKIFPDIPLMVDANSAYTLNDLEHLKRFDEFQLMMIEQPLGHDDILEHAKLQKEIQTPICLDESIYSLKDVQTAVELNACQIINVKVSRVGGISEVRRINKYCREQKVPLWCGGMLDAGVGRAHNIAITTLSQFVLPGDTSSSSRYWHEDIIEPEVTMNHGEIAVPEKAGIGYEINWPVVEKYRLEKKVYQK